jgi:XTP/dITP diphosphohydrolase
MRQRVFEGNKLVIASHNEGKIREIRDLLKPLKIDVLSAKDFKMIEPDENGVSFEENALIKSNFVSKQSGLPSLSDDSGICFPDLNNSPGIYSARWAGKNKNFSLAMLKGISWFEKIEKTCKQMFLYLFTFFSVARWL